MNINTFEPKIIAFCCHYCAFAAADLAGSMRLQYPPNIRIIRTPCTGRLEVDYFMKGFEKGADGILVAGCLEGGCHFIDGNYYGIVINISVDRVTISGFNIQHCGEWWAGMVIFSNNNDNIGRYIYFNYVINQKSVDWINCNNKKIIFNRKDNSIEFNSINKENKLEFEINLLE